MILHDDYRDLCDLYRYRDYSLYRRESQCGTITSLLPQSRLCTF